MRWLLTSVLMFTLVGCSNLQMDELAATGATAGAALVTTALTVNPVAGAAVGVAAGTAVSVITPASNAAADPTACDTPECVEAFATAKRWDTVMDFIHWIIGGCVVLLLAAWLIPGPQLWFERRNKDDKSNRPDRGNRSGRRN